MAEAAAGGRSPRSGLLGLGAEGVQIGDHPAQRAPEYGEGIQIFLEDAGTSWNDHWGHCFCIAHPFVLGPSWGGQEENREQKQQPQWKRA